MLSTDTSHYPSADDIAFDSLAYLFNPAATVNQTPIPWVDVRFDSKLPEKDIVELQAKLLLLEHSLQQNTGQMKRMCTYIGYINGLLYERDEQLKALPDLRFLAAQAVARGLEAERYKEKIQELNVQIDRLNQCSCSKLAEMFKTLSNSLRTDEAAITFFFCLGLIALAGILLAIVR